MLRKSIVLAAALAISPAATAQETRLAPGASATIELAENPSTGFSWRIDEIASEGLDRVEILDAGYKRGASRPGAAGTHSWKVTGVKPGRAVVQFAYQRPWEPRPVETRRLVFNVSP